MFVCLILKSKRKKRTNLRAGSTLSLTGVEDARDGKEEFQMKLFKKKEM